MTIDRERVRRVFADYTAGYNARDPKIKLKIDHTYRVAAMSEQIAASLSLSAGETELAWLIGMLHDVGRFEQVQRFGSFADAPDRDHAKICLRVLFDEGHIRDYLDDPGQDAVIHAAIAAHNLYEIPAGQEAHTLLFCKLLRDADKVDIWKANTLTPLETVHNVTTAELRNSAVTPAVMAAFCEGHTVLRSLRKTAADHVVSLISLAFGLEFPESLRLAKQQGCLDQLLDFCSDNPDTQRDFAIIRQKMNVYLAAHT